MQDITKYAEQQKQAADQVKVLSEENTRLHGLVEHLRGTARGLNAQLTTRSEELDKMADLVAQFQRQKQGNGGTTLLIP